MHSSRMRTGRVSGHLGRVYTSLSTSLCPHLVHPPCPHPLSTPSRRPHPLDVHTPPPYTRPHSHTPISLSTHSPAQVHAWINTPQPSECWDTQPLPKCMLGYNPSPVNITTDSSKNITFASRSVKIQITFDRDLSVMFVNSASAKCCRFRPGSNGQNSSTFQNKTWNMMILKNINVVRIFKSSENK